MCPRLSPRQGQLADVTSVDRTPIVVRRLLVLLLLVPGFGLAVVGSSHPARAACADSSNVVDALTQAEVVFVGLVTSVASDDRIALMQVVEIWKGPDLQPTVKVHGGDPHTSTAGPEDRAFEVGRTYLVVPSNGSPPFEDSLCTATMPYRPTGSIPPEYGPAVGAFEVRYAEDTDAALEAPTAIESLADLANSPAVWVAITGVFVLGIGFVFYRGGAKRRKGQMTQARRKPQLRFASMFNQSREQRLRKLRSRSK